jgi:predicted anti-sigma-YlaC factor YlaD
LEARTARPNGAGADAHLQACAGCRGFVDHAAHVTRLSRTTLVVEVPDMVEAILAAGPRSRRPALVMALRVLLGVVGVAQVVIALDGVLGAHGPGGMQMEGASMVHFAHESAAWNLALGVGFCWVAARSSRTSGVVPTLATFIVVLTTLMLIDLTTGQADLSRLLMHGWAMAGLMLVIVLDRWRPPASGPLPGGNTWSQHRPGRAPTTDPAPSPADHDQPGLRPTAHHHDTAAA